MRGDEADGGTSFDHDEGFTVITLPMDTYVDTSRFALLEEVVAEAEGVAGLLTDWGGEHRPWKGQNRTSGATKSRLREWSDARPPRNSMLIWLGHGESNEDDALLAVCGEGIDGKDDDIQPEELGRYLVEQFQGRARSDCWAVVVVEACGAARFIDKLLAHVVDKRAAERLVIIGSGADQGRGYLASFREVLTTVLDEFSGNYSHIRLRDLAQRIQDLLDPGRVWYQLAGDEILVRQAGAAQPVIMTLEDYARPHAVAPAGASAGAGPGGSGAGEEVAAGIASPVPARSPSGELAWLFVGRTGERDRIAGWLADTGNGVLAVTGPPGCGKSALLGHILLHAAGAGEPSEARSAPRHEPWPESVPRPGADTFLNLTGASVRQVVDQLAEVFAVSALPETSNDDERIRALLDAVRPGGRRWTLFADALDAADDANRIADLLRALGELPDVRLVVGTRPSSADRLDLPGAEVEDLLEALGCAGADVLRLCPDPQDLADYVTQALLAERDVFTGLGIDPEAAVQRVVALVCGAPRSAGRDFLFATLAVHEIIADPTLLLRDRRENLADLLGGEDHRRLFRAVVSRVREALPGGMAVLRALAFAQGHGLPRAERIWATIASALHEGPVDGTLLDEVARTAAPYIMLDAEDGQAVYRLAHRAFRDFVLDEDDPRDTRRAERERLRVATELTRLAAAKDEGMTAVPRPHPYLVRHLAAHAAEAGPEGWRMLSDHPGVLDHLDPVALAGAALRSGARLAALPGQVTGALALAHLAAAATPADRKGLRELGSLRTAGSATATDRTAPYDGPAASWTVRWATLPQCAPHLTLAGLGVPVRALRVLTRRADGRKLLVGAGDAGVRAWDLRTGLETAPALRGGPREGAQCALAPLGGPYGADRIAAAGVDRTLRQWDVLTGRPVGSGYSLSADAVRAMAPFAGKLAIGDLQGRLWLFDPVEGREGTFRTGHHGPLNGMAVFEAPGSGDDRLVTVDARGWALVWCPDRGRPETEWRAHEEGARAVTAFTDPTEGVVLAVTGEDGTVRLWDARGRELGRLTGHEGPVYAVTAFSDPENGTVLTTGGQDGTVRLWDPRDPRGGELGRLTGHEGPVYAVTAFSDPENGTVLATGGQDGTVRLWDPRGRSATGPPVRTASVRAMADTAAPGPGGTLAVAYTGGSVAWLDGADGSVRTASSCGGDVVALATLGSPGGTMTATAHQDGTVRVNGLLAGGAEGDRTVLPPAPACFLTGASTEQGRPAFFGITAGGELRWWDARTGCLLGRAPTGLTAPFTALTTIERGPVTALAVVGDGGHRVWWSASPEGPWKPLLPGSRGRLAAVAAVRGPTEAHRALVGVGPEGELRVWDHTGTRLLHTVRLGLRCHALTALGEGAVAVGTGDGVVVIDLNTGAWADAAMPGPGAPVLGAVVFGEGADRSTEVA
jgi:WD40 repeat protein